MLVCTALLPFLLIRMRSHQDLGGRAARSRVAIPPGCAGHKCAPYLSQPRAAGQADAADPEHDEGGEPPRRDDQSRLGTASTTGARASTPAEAREAVVSGPGRAPVRRPASPSAPSSSASPAPCTGPPRVNTRRCRDLARSWSRPGPAVRAAAAVAEAARERLARAPPVMAMAWRVLDPRPAWPASRATDAENTAREASERSWPPTLIRSGPASPWKNRWTSVMSAPGRGKGASARLRPVARPPMKLTPVSTPPRAPGLSNLAVFATPTLRSCALAVAVVVVLVPPTRQGPAENPAKGTARAGWARRGTLARTV